MSENETNYNYWRNFLLSHVFSFGVHNGATYTKELSFNPNGNIDHYSADNESHWELTNDKLLLKNQAFETTTEFVLPKKFGFGSQEQIVGTYLKNPDIKHQLATVIEKGAHNPDIVANRVSTVSNQIQNNISDTMKKTFSVLPSVRKTGNKTIHVAFILNSAETLPALFPLISVLIKNKEFEVKILATDKQFGGTKLGTIDNLCNFLDKNLKYQYIRLENNFENALINLQYWGADFIVRQSEWDNDFPAAFSGRNLSWSRLIHIPYTVNENFLYSPEAGHKTVIANPYFRLVWRHFLSEKLDEEQFGDIQQSFISTDCFSVIGSMKAQMIKNAKPKWPFPKSKNKKIVWMAHHSIGHSWFNMGYLPNIYQDVLKWIKEHPDIEVVFNPHPLLKKIIQVDQSSGLTIDEYNKLLVNLEKLPNASVFQGKNQYSLTAAADAILTDGISSIYEMQIQFKKIVTLLRPDHGNLTQRGKELLTGTHVVDGAHIEEALKTVERLLSSTDDKQIQQVKNTAEWLQNEHPEQLIIDEMLEEMNRK